MLEGLLRLLYKALEGLIKHLPAQNYLKTKPPILTKTRPADGSDLRPVSLLKTDDRLQYDFL